MHRSRSVSLVLMEKFDWLLYVLSCWDNTRNVLAECTKKPLCICPEEAGFVLVTCIWSGAMVRLQVSPAVSEICLPVATGLVCAGSSAGLDLPASRWTLPPSSLQRPPSWDRRNGKVRLQKVNRGSWEHVAGWQMSGTKGGDTRATWGK